MNVLSWMGIGFIAALVFDSFFEWTFHRHVMHRRLWKFGYPFEKHALVHHRVFKADETYHLRDEKDRWTVPMAWWNGPALVALTQIPFTIVAWTLGEPGLVYGSLLAGLIYYGAYEYLHWCMHIPRKRNVERTGIFFRLNGHHLLHHRYMNRNFNVVLPLADWCLGTLMVRARTRFAQAQGPGVPNVQPRAAKKRRLGRRFWLLWPAWDK